MTAAPEGRDYSAVSGHYDEMAEPSGSLRPHWRGLVDALQQLGSDELSRRWREGQRLIQENGVTYNVYGDPRGIDRPWQLDAIPLLVSSQEWQGIEAAVSQRALLLDRMLADAYGERRLLRDGLLPPELVLANPGFLRACHGIRVPGDCHLHVYAADLARSPNGQWWVIGDRSQAPSGAGYALENRVVLSRVFPSVFRDSHVHRLPHFFRRLRSTLISLHLRPDESAHLVLLTPGAGNETYFEHAYLANYLGCTLAQGEDLTVRDQRLWLRTLDGLRKVDVVLRRVDTAFCDPLEMRADSMLGTPGLLQAARTANVAIANPPGTSVVENPALMAFLPRLARELLGADLELPSVRTWWCGQAEERAWVLDHLEELVVKPIYPHSSGATYFGATLRENERQSLLENLERQPHLYVGQEHLPLSRAPVLIGKGRFEPRALVLRAFLTAEKDGYAVMPGGLCRVASSRESSMVSNQRGGVSKDVWVLASEPERDVSLLLPADRPIAIERGGQEVPGRVADNLFWLGRYMERTNGSGRVLREALGWLLDPETRPSEPQLATLLRAVADVTGAPPGSLGGDLSTTPAVAEILSVIGDPDRVGSLRFNVAALLRTGRGVRDRFSTDMWRVIAALDQEMQRRTEVSNALELLDGVLLHTSAFAGLCADGMTRGQRWRFLEIGRRLERTLFALTLLRAFCPPRTAAAHVPWEALLVIADATMTYRQRYRSSADSGGVLDLLLDDESNPRSVHYLLLGLDDLLDGLTAPEVAGQASPEQGLVRDALVDLRGTASLGRSVSRRLDAELDELLARLQTRISSLSDQLTARYFRKQRLVRVV